MSTFPEACKYRSILLNEEHFFQLLWKILAPKFHRCLDLLMRRHAMDCGRFPWFKATPEVLKKS